MERHRIDKAALRETITALEGLTNEQKADLLQLLSEQKRYGLVWEDHAEDVEEQLRTKLPVLTEDVTKRILSTDEGAPNHVLIEGDNLHALTALTYTHEGKVDVIYIDPPYNTGNKDFVYNDSFVDGEDGYRHSKWLSFMHKRLKIAKRLLSDRGVIFISIDDNEQANLKLLCDEVFGENNFVGGLIHQRAKGGGQAKYVVKGHDYILVYGKDKTKVSLTRKKVIQQKTYEINGELYIKNDDVIRKQFGKYDKSLGDRRCFYEQLLEYKGPEKKAEVDALLQKGEYFLELNKDGMHTICKYEKVADATSKLYSIIKVLSEEGKKDLEQLGINNFSYPKPVELIKQLIESAAQRYSLILDFFAGSGTTLHATMQLNAEDGGHRQCILVTNNENGICENVTYERNRRVIQGYTTPKGVEVPGLSGNNLRYYRTDFVERETTRTAKRQLMMASTELLCIKHDIYDEQRTFGSITLRPTIARYFTGRDTLTHEPQQMLIIYRTEAIESLVAEIAQMPESTNILVYVFSTTNYAMDADFEEVSNKVTLCALPAAIYNAYLRVLPKRKMNDALRYDDDALRYDDDNDNMGGTEA